MKVFSILAVLVSVSCLSEAFAWGEDSRERVARSSTVGGITL